MGVSLGILRRETLVLQTTEVSNLVWLDGVIIMFRLRRRLIVREIRDFQVGRVPEEMTVLVLRTLLVLIVVIREIVMLENEVGKGVGSKRHFIKQTAHQD